MKFLKNGVVINSRNRETEIIKDDEKIMTLSIIVPKKFDGEYCQECPIWCDDISCSVVGICPLENLN